MTNCSEEIELINNWTNNDCKISFTKLFELYRKELTGFAKSVLNNDEDALDIIQDLYLKIYVKRIVKNKPGNFSFKAYMITNIRNAIVDKYRYESRKIRRNVDWNDVITIINGTDELIKFYNSKDEITASYNRVIASLKNEQIEVISLRLKGFAYKDIARMRNSKMNTAQGIMRYAVEKIKQNISSQDFEVLERYYQN